MATRPPLAKEIYATLSGEIKTETMPRIFANFAEASNQKVEVVHLLIQSPGGFVGDGIGAYNFLRSLPLKIVTYNGGLVASIAVIVFLCGAERVASETAAFLIHRSTIGPITGTSTQLQDFSAGLAIDDNRSESILKSHINLSDEKWEIQKRSNLIISSAEAMQIGLIHRIGDWTVPKGQQIYNVV
jgi:ATP-dependent Clp protease protease subunit